MDMKSHRDKSKRNVWKIVSIVFIALFVLIILWVMVGLRTKPEFTPLTQEQISMAEAVVAGDLTAMGDGIESYEVFVTESMVGFVGDSHKNNGMRGMGPQGCPGGDCFGRSVQVSLRGNSTGYLYMIDLESEKVTMRSFTEWFNE